MSKDLWWLFECLQRSREFHLVLRDTYREPISWIIKFCFVFWLDSKPWQDLNDHYRWNFLTLTQFFFMDVRNYVNRTSFTSEVNVSIHLRLSISSSIIAVVASPKWRLMGVWVLGCTLGFRFCHGLPHPNDTTFKGMKPGASLK